MKLFQLTQKHFALLGISLCQSKQKYSFLNRKILKVYFCYWFAIILYFASFIWETHTFREYTELIFKMLIPILLAIVFTIVVMKMEILFEIIDKCESIVDKSKSFISLKRNLPIYQ